MDCLYGDSPRELTSNSVELDRFVHITHRNWLAVQRHLEEEARAVRAVAVNVATTIRAELEQSDSDGRPDRTDNAPGPKDWFLKCPRQPYDTPSAPAPPADQIPATKLDGDNKEVMEVTEDDVEFFEELN